MPLSEFAKILVRTQALSPEDWARLVEDRRKLVYSSIGEMGRKKLGDTLYLYQNDPTIPLVERVRDNLKDDSITSEIPAALNLERLGVFRPVCNPGSTTVPGSKDSHVAYVYGISSRCDWVLATISFNLPADQNCRKPCPVGKRVDIRQVALPELLGICRALKPQDILRDLCRAINATCEKKQKSAMEWRARWHAVRAEDELLHEVLRLTGK